MTRFTRFFDIHYEDVLRYAARRVDEETAHDIAAGSFLIAWRKQRELPADDAEVLPWLYAVARRVLANEHRRERRGSRLAAKLAGFLGAGFLGGETPDPSVDVGATLDLSQALSVLSPKDQEILQLIGWEELTIRQVAVVIGCSPATAAVRAHRARQRLLAILSDQGLLLDFRQRAGNGRSDRD
ncbi:RNA polymerase sigma factor [Sinosporangium siamense]|uniref:RNA polymerase sigma factor n=1 Tax=Sinosporangium siamense TaxID=1367973 RepID=UPI00194FB46E|nr:sigma-70 family RNA polymerase sigma factor [Sinosporangium siamense]